nr:diphosphoinositol polyphosphate phosphohydrolase NUDT4B-like isoform X2 [Labrus bergylta]
MMKFKPNQTRTYDGEGFKRRAACLCLKSEKEDEAGVKGKLGRLLGIFEHNQDSKHRTYVYTLVVTETLEDWEDSVSIGRKRKWFKVDEAIRVLQSHKPDHAEYIRTLMNTSNPNCSPVYNSTNGNTPSAHVSDNNTPHYVVCSSGSDLVNR